MSDRCEPPTGTKAWSMHVLRFRNQNFRFQWNPRMFTWQPDRWAAGLPGNGEWIVEVETATRDGWRYIGPVEDENGDLTPAGLLTVTDPFAHPT